MGANWKETFFFFQTDIPVYFSKIPQAEIYLCLIDTIGYITFLSFP